MQQPRPHNLHASLYAPTNNNSPGSNYAPPEPTNKNMTGATNVAGSSPYLVPFTPGAETAEV